MRVVVRFAIAAAVSAGVCWALWSRRPRSLSGQTDIIGYPTFANYEYRAPFWVYRIALFAFPAILIGCYALLARFGPPRRPSRAVVHLLDRSSTETIADPPLSIVLSQTLRLVLPILVIGLAVFARPGQHHWLLAAAGSTAYLAAVGVAAALWSRLVKRSMLRTGSSSFWDGFALANGVGGAAAALFALWLVSHYTIAYVGGRAHRLPWMPLWLSIAGILVVLGWAWFRIRRETPVRVIERRLLVVVVGAVGVFLMLSTLPPGIDAFAGFDDAQELAGAFALNRGELPWRDFLFIHGLFPDVLRGTIGWAVFGTSIWGSWAGTSVLLAPLFWVFNYLFAAWVSRGNAWFLSLFAIAAVSGYLPPLETRFIAVPMLLMLTGEAIRRRTVRWAVGLTLALFVEGVVVPETAYLVASALLCVLASDVVHRRRAEPAGWRKTFRFSLWCLGTGAAVCLAFALLLAASGTLGSFISYYLVFGPGHNEAGAIAAFGITPLAYTLYYAGLVCVLLTIWATAARVRRQGDWRAQDWVAIAAAGFVALYGEKALGRLDQPHLLQVITVALPLIAYWAWKLLRMADPLVDRLSSPRWGATFGNVATAAALTAIVITAWLPLDAYRQSLDGRHRIAAETDSLYPGVGFSTSTAVDPVMIKDLDTALTAYAGKDQPVFDMTNGLGYLYYLLKREPGTRFLHVSMAVPPYAQQILIGELKRSRPPVVVYDSYYIGLPAWDGVENTVRHYQVSQYVLDNYVPVLRTHGNLLMLRRDLAEHSPPLPALSERPVTEDLWYTGRACNWGTSPMFLQSQPTGRSTAIPLANDRQATVVDITGWAVDPTSRRPAQAVLLLDGDKVLTVVRPDTDRRDVAASLKVESSLSGFHLAGQYPPGKRFKVYMLGDDGLAYPLKGSIRHDLLSVTMPDGRVVRTGDGVGGVIDVDATADMTISETQLPAGLNLADFDLATVATSGAPIGDSSVVLSDEIGDSSHYISARSVMSSGLSRLSVRVGSCLQWQGFSEGDKLYVLQTAGNPVSTLTLSGVKD